MAESARTRAIEATIIASMILAIELFAVASFGASSNQISAGLSSFPSSQNVSQVHVTIVPGSSVDTSLGYGTSTITVVLGVNNTVTWTNDDSEVHTVTSNDGSFDSGMIYSGATFTYTFVAAGTFDYHCQIHPWMKGTVIVKLQSG